MWIDSHCHLNHERTADGDTPEAIVARAKSGGVDGMLSICCEIEREFSSLLKTVKALDNVWCSIGTHPHDAGLPAEKAVTLEKLIDLANSDDKIIGIGESGLDFFYNHSTPEDQEESFRKHIRACIATNLPLIVHARDADADIMRVIRDENAKAGAKVRGVMHCFSSGDFGGIAVQGPCYEFACIFYIRRFIGFSPIWGRRQKRRVGFDQQPVKRHCFGDCLKLR